MSGARKHNRVCLEVVKLSISPTYLFKFLGLKSYRVREKEREVERERVITGAEITWHSTRSSVPSRTTNSPERGFCNILTLGGPEITLVEQWADSGSGYL